jgi:hypothetical protein
MKYVQIYEIYKCVCIYIYICVCVCVWNGLETSAGGVAQENQEEKLFVCDL